MYYKATSSLARLVVACLALLPYCICCSMSLKLCCCVVVVFVCLFLLVLVSWTDGHGRFMLPCMAFLFLKTTREKRQKEKGEREGIT